MPRSELFIGNLQNDLTSKEIEDVFEKYGRILKCELKNKGPGASFCFVEYEDERDAEEALRSENGKDLHGREIVVEFAKGKRREGGPGGRGGPGGFRGDDRRGGGPGGPRRGGNECYNCGQSGHFARDCRGGGSGGGSGGGRRPGGDRDGGRDFRGGDRERGSGSSRHGGDRDRRRSRSRSRS